MQSNVFLWCLIGVFLVLFPADAAGQGRSVHVFGVRAGFSDSRNHESFTQGELFTSLALPWHWKTGSGWTIEPLIDLTAGVLNGGGERGFVGTIGPSLALSSPEQRVAFFAGISPTVLSRYEYGDDNFGGFFQFTSHAGLRFWLVRRVALGYRIQHMSNAGIYDHNPGLNLHMVELGFRF